MATTVNKITIFKGSVIESAIRYLKNELLVPDGTKTITGATGSFAMLWLIGASTGSHDLLLTKLII